MAALFCLSLFSMAALLLGLLLDLLIALARSSSLISTLAGI